MRIWIDITGPAHVLVFRPLIALLRERGHEVEVTAREYSQTIQLLQRHGIDAEVIGGHGGRSRARKLAVMVERMPKLRRWAKGRRFDAALAHGSHYLTLAARTLGIPSSTTFDYEFATLQHQFGCRAANYVVVPEAIPPERLERYGARPPKLRRYPGLKEEYYLADFEPDPAVVEQLGLDREQVIVTVRTPPAVALYHRQANPLFPSVLKRLAEEDGVQTVVLPRTADQADDVRGLAYPSIRVPDEAVDAQSLVFYSDLVVGAGGTVNREAAALGVPVYTTFSGRLGGVDEWLVSESRLRPLTDPAALELVKRSGEGARVRRDPSDLLALLMPV
jgi:predicted glycosyltransferase